MAHFPDDCIEGQFASDAQRTKRLKEIDAWLGYFLEMTTSRLGNKVEFFDNAASQINSCYWESLEERVRPRIQPHEDGTRVYVDRHKICSVMELTVAFLQPIVSVDGRSDELDSWNAKLAYFIALNIIGNWDAGKVRTLFVSKSFDREHQTWLRYLSQTRDFHIFSNAATWYLVEQYCLLKSSTAP